MVEDKEIKATVSPFAIRPGEIKVFDGKDGYVSMIKLSIKLMWDILMIYILKY